MGSDIKEWVKKSSTRKKGCKHCTEYKADVHCPKTCKKYCSTIRALAKSTSDAASRGSVGGRFCECPNGATIFFTGFRTMYICLIFSTMFTSFFFCTGFFNPLLYITACEEIVHILTREFKFTFNILWRSWTICRVW